MALFNKIKSTTLVIASATILSLTACGNGAEEAETITEATDEAAESLDGFVEPTVEDFEYNYDAAIGGIVITRYSGQAEAIRIPAEIDGEPVKQVSFFVGKGLTHVEIPDGVTSIGDFAFTGCDGLEVTYKGKVYTNVTESGWKEQ